LKKKKAGDKKCPFIAQLQKKEKLLLSDLLDHNFFPTRGDPFLKTLQCAFLDSFSDIFPGYLNLAFVSPRPASQGDTLTCPSPNFAVLHFSLTSISDL
jgi:hypothetical protein